MSTNNVSDINWGPRTKDEEVNFQRLLAKLKESVCVKPAAKRAVNHTVSEFAGHEVTSWKSVDFMYKKEPCPLPTQARGLFTCVQDGKEQIATRGYNKFFNINEVPKTKWSWIEKNTHGPYEMTVKEDGCLILAGGLDGGKTLIITSKQAIGLSHSVMARKWMERHLSQVGKTVEEFATFLHERNATAVFELCDDAFEEHILEYPERMRGLYLHGINRNSVELDTWPSAEVAKVAKHFGFIAIKRFEFATIEEGREFADKVRKDELLEGRVIEGFVTRCKLNGSDEPYMFKIKHDIPYLMFYEWRKVTDSIIAKKPFHTTYPMSKHYAAWVKQRIKANPAEFALFRSQKSTFEVRRRFIEFYKQHGGGDEKELYDQIFQMEGGARVLLMPVASIGCGKTTLALALSRLFGFGHVQNDELTGKKNGRGLFHETVLSEFDGKTFVFADRTNHVLAQRKSLTTAIQAELVNCRIVALYWVHDEASAQAILEKNIDRVVARGEAHQVLTPKRTPEFRRVMNGHITALAPLDLESESDKLIDDVIELDPLADSATNLRTVVDELCNMFPDTLKPPSENEVNQALEYALSYKPEVRTIAYAKKEKNASFGLVPSDVEFTQCLEQAMSDSDNKAWGMCRTLLSTQCYKRNRYITLFDIKFKNDSKYKALYKGFVELFSKSSVVSGTEAACIADFVVCNGKVAVLRVASMVVDDCKKAIPRRVIKKKLDKGKVSIATTCEIPHIVLGATEDAVVAQAHDMLNRVFGSNNASEPQRYPAGWSVIPVNMRFTAVFDKFIN